MNGYSARVKDGSLKTLLAERYDVVCLQETKIARRPLRETVALYHASWRCCDSAYAGVAVFTAEAPLQVLDAGVKEIDDEGRILAVEIPSAWVVSAYSPTFIRSPEREAYRFRYEDVLRSFVARLMATGKPVVLCGDLNVTAADIDCHQAPLYAGTPNHSAAERESFHSLIDLGLTDVWRTLHPVERRYSWMMEVNTPFEKKRLFNSGFRFDYILATSGVVPVSSDILVSHPGSDHVPVIADVRI